MSVEAESLAEYAGKRVVVTRNLSEPDSEGNKAVEVEGEVQVGNEMGILIKPKGQVQFKLIPIDEIEEVRLAETKVSKLKASKLAPVKIGSARRHLLERHGVTLAWANSVTEEQAKEYHDGLDHVELDLGHIHGEKDEKKDSEENAESGDSEE